MSRPERIAQFRKAAGKGWYITSLRETAEYRGREAAAVANWFLREPVARPQCFCCRRGFTAEKRPSAFLCATPSRAPHAGTAVAGCCVMCWGKAPAEIEAAAAELLRRQLCPRGHFLDEGVSR